LSDATVEEDVRSIHGGEMLRHAKVRRAELEAVHRRLIRSIRMLAMIRRAYVRLDIARLNVSVGTPPPPAVEGPPRPAPMELPGAVAPMPRASR
jgi:hypothetical protein